MHMATPSPVTTVLIFPEKYKKKKKHKTHTDSNKTGPRLKLKPGGKKQQ